MSPKQWGAIRRLPSGRLQASYTVAGIRYTAPTTFSDDVRTPGGTKPRTAEAKAQEWLRGVRVQVESGRWVSPEVEKERAEVEAKKSDAERFGKYARAWLDQRVNSKGQPLRPKTRAEYERQLDRGLSIFLDDRITAITPARVRAWHADRMKSGKTAAGAEARLLRAIMNTALVDGIITSNPVDSKLTRSQTGVKHRPPTLDELAVMLDTIDPKFRLALLLASYGGLRIGEWRALRRRDLTVEEDRVFVDVMRTAQYIVGQGWVVGEPKSAEGVRIVPLPKSLTDDVRLHLEAYVGAFGDDLLFHSSGSEFVHDAQFNRSWNKARDAAGVRVRVEDGRYVSVVREHDLRAFAATMHAQSGATLRETMKLLGHSTTVAAMAYQATTGRESELADRMTLPPSKPKTMKAIGT